MEKLASNNEEPSVGPIIKVEEFINQLEILDMLPEEPIYLQAEAVAKSATSRQNLADFMNW